MLKPKLFQLPGLYAITDTRLCGLSHAEQVESLIRGGATLIQLREKHLPSGRFHDQAEAALRVARARGARVIINDRVDIALALKADGVHLGQQDLSPVVARQILGPDAIIGLSTHNKEQAKEGVSFPIDYLAAGPIFRTHSKQDSDPILGLEGLCDIRRMVNNLPLVAIGGITFEQAPEVFKAGADCIALIGALLSSPQEIEVKTKAFSALASSHARKF